MKRIIFICLFLKLFILPLKVSAAVGNDRGIPILMYHSIAYEKGNNLRMPKEKFREQMKYIRDNNYKTLTISELYDFIVNNKTIPEKSVVITLDDGYVDNYTSAFPILKEYGLKATVFVVTSTIDKDKRCLNTSQIKEMDSYGINIESHTVKHEELNKMTYNEQLKTLKESKKALEEILKRDVNCIAYPYGKYNDDTLKATKEAGYNIGLRTGGRVARKGNGIYTLYRINVLANEDMSVFKGKLSSK